MDSHKYRLIFNLIDFLDEKLDSNINLNDESTKIILQIKEIILTEIKNKEENK